MIFYRPKHPLRKETIFVFYWRLRSKMWSIEDNFHPFSILAQRRAEADFVSKLISLGGVQASQIQRRLRLDDSFSQGKREVNVILTTDYTIYCFLIRNWKGNFSPGSDGKYWIERQETEENVNVRQFPSPLVDAEQQVKLLHRFGQNYLLRYNLKYLLNIKVKIAC